VCRAIVSGSALDIVEIDAASNTGVDNIRELIERAQFSPVQCRHKVYIIDEVHMLSTAAFNALLKTLEEPPERVVFVLATTDPQRVLPTIISRCQRFDFRRIPLAAMVQHLKHIATQETISITDEAITLVAQVAQGGLRDAESLLDQLSLLAGEVTVEKVWDLVGAVPERDLMQLIEAIASNNPEILLERTRHLLERGREPLIVLQNFASFYRDLLIAKTAPNRNDLVTCTQATWTQLCEFAQSWEIGTILAGQKHLKDSEVQIKNTTQPRLWLEITLLGLLPAASQVQSPRPEVNFTPSASQVQSPRPEVNFAPPPSKPSNTSPPRQLEPQQPTPETSQKPPIEPVIATVPPAVIPQPSASIPEKIADVVQADTNGQPNLEQLWQQVVANLSPFATQALVRQHCCLLAFEGQQARISISSEKLLKLAQGKAQNIEAAFQIVRQHPVKVVLQVATQKEAKTTSVREPVSRSPNATEVNTQVAEAIAPTYLAATTPANAVMEVSSAEVTAATSQVTAPPLPDWTTEELAKAAKSLAQFFCGDLVQMTDEPELAESYVSHEPSNAMMDAVITSESDPEEDEIDF
jgi:DNA polymerase-3 subunit gamma/tau